MAFRSRFGPPSPGTVHLCIDMQTLFAERKDWHVPWLQRVLPTVLRLAETHPMRTILTRFVPQAQPEEAVGAGRRYYRHWRAMTGAETDICVLAAVMMKSMPVPGLCWPRMHSAACQMNCTPPRCGILVRASATRSRSPLPRRFSQAGPFSLLLAGEIKIACGKGAFAKLAPPRAYFGFNRLLARRGRNLEVRQIYFHAPLIGPPSNAAAPPFLCWLWP